MSFNTPVIFIIFRRPHITARVFEAIRNIKPTKFLVIADGPREPADVELCKQTRAVTEAIDWDCEVLRNYSETNLGCKQRVSSGLDWAFSQVEEAIIIEDDCLPHPSFFSYCEKLLSLYRDDERIMVISGNNFQDRRTTTSQSYYFSKYNHCWGWATWRRAWKFWEFSPEKWIEFRDAGFIHSLCPNNTEAEYWTKVFNTLFLEGRPDSWGYAWTFACWSQNGLTALPEKNLVSNIGFAPNATHTKGTSKHAEMPTYAIEEITHPTLVVRDEKADQYTFSTVFGGNKIKTHNKPLNRLKRRIHTFYQGGNK